MIRSPLIALVLGLIAIAAPIAVYIYTRQVHEQDMQGIHQMRAQLDSSRAVLAAAGTAADSQRLTEQIRAREAGISRRAYHVPIRQARLDGWWRPTVPATLFVAVGAVLVAVALVVWRRG